MQGFQQNAISKTIDNTGRLKVTSLQNAAMLPSVYRMANAVRPLGRNNRNDPCTTGNKQHIMAWEKQFLYSEEHNLFI